jgi:hypothetical protein
MFQFMYVCMYYVRMYVGIYSFICMFVCGLLNNCVNGSDYTASNESMTSLWRTGKDRERSGRGLIGSTLGICEGMRKSTQHLTAVNTRSVFRDEVPYILTGICPHLRDRIRQTTDGSEETAVSIQTLVHTYIPECTASNPRRQNYYSHYHDNLKYKVIQDSSCASRDSYRAPPEYKPKTFQLQPICLT